MYDPDELVTFEHGVFVVDPALMYPATIARIVNLDPFAVPQEFESVEAGMAQKERVAKFPADAWVLAITPFEQLDPAHPTARELRALALGEARQWFVRALAAKHPGEKLTLHITKNLDYKE